MDRPQEAKPVYRFALLRHLPHYRSSWGRGRCCGRLLDFLSWFLSFSGLAKRPISNGGRQSHDRNNSAENARQSFRIHFEVPVVCRAIVSQGGS